MIRRVRLSRGQTPLDLCEEGSAWAVARLNGRLVDLGRRLAEDAEVELLDLEEPEGLEVLRHTTSHVMAQAVKRLFGGRLGIGPVVAGGFYYDFDLERPLRPEDLERIEEAMRQIVAEDLPVVRQEMSREEAVALFRERGEIYKVELLEEIPEERVSVYRQGEFVDLCRGPHLPSTGRLRAFKLTGVAGAYWRGDERNPMLQRIYGTAFPTDEALREHLARLEEARRRDHRRLGRELGLILTSEEAGPGLILWPPQGAMVRWLLEEFILKEHLRRGYQLVRGPEILKVGLWERSGHLDNYAELMFFTEAEAQRYALKPMNCLGHILIYRSRVRSYRELPLRYFELGTVHRLEKSGVLHGLLRAREFTQDDAHIFCREDQLVEEIGAVLRFVAEVMETFGFDYELELSTRPRRYIGDEEIWRRSTQALRTALEATGRPYGVNEGEGAFYGPKIDVKVRDSLGRTWQCSTVQCDFNLPERFDLTYVGADGSRHRPAMVHRVILGTLERFLGILIEHYGGAFPLWLAPLQVALLPIADRHLPYAREVLDRLREREFRASIDERSERLSLKVREAQLQKVPYMLILGDREAAQRTVAVRTRRGEDLGSRPLEEFIRMLEEQRASRALQP